MKIVVPIVASYPDRRGVLRNARLCREQGHEVRIDPAIRRRGKFSDLESYGTPEQRARSLKKLVLNGQCSKEPFIVATATGGYGSVRALYRLPKHIFRNTVAVGFSDTTAVAARAALESEYPAFHGPCFEDREFMEALPYYTLQKSGWEAPITFADHWPRNRKIGGIVWGGNLTIFNYMIQDVRSAPKFGSGKAILFFEDIYDKDTYPQVDVGALVGMEFDRLEYAGIFERTVAVILGRFPGMRKPRLLKILRKFYKGPVAGLDIGHAYGERSWALMPPIPLGTRTILSREGDALVCTWWSRQKL